MLSLLKHRLPIAFLWRLLLVAALVLLTAGCGPAATPGTLAPVPTLQTIRLGYTPALKPWAQDAARCAEGMSDTAFFSIEITEEEDIPLEIQLSYYSGSSTALQDYIFTVGEENLALITNKANQISTIDPGTAEAVFSGRIDDWQVISGQPISATLPFSSKIVLFSYPSGDSLRSALSAATKSQVPPQAVLVPDPGAMLQAVSDNPGALGYVPERWLEDAVNIRQIDVLTVGLTIIATTPSQPGGAVKALLACLQNP